MAPLTGVTCAERHRGDFVKSPGGARDAGGLERPLPAARSGWRDLRRGADARRAGRILGELALPTVLVQEGGYNLESLGQLMREVLLGVEEGAA